MDKGPPSAHTQEAAMSRVIVIQFMTLDGVVDKEVADLLGKRGLETPLGW